MWGFITLASEDYVQKENIVNIMCFYKESEGSMPEHASWYQNLKI